MAESFEKLDNTFRDWAKNKVQKSLAEILNRYEKEEEEDKKAVSFSEHDSEKYSSCLGR